MKTSDFDYVLPEELIAQHSVEPRDHSRLMLVDREKQSVADYVFHELPGLLKKGDLLVFNNSKVFKARLEATIGNTEVEIFLLRESQPGVWEALGKPGKKIPVGGAAVFKDLAQAKILSKNDEGILMLDFGIDKAEVLSLTEKYGEVPIPPYVSKNPEALSTYQNIYAQESGSVAAPTAGFHFTEKVFKELKEKEIDTAFVTLHVGLGTFLPIRTEELGEHQMHEEYFEISEETRQKIDLAKKEGRRVIAVGTTTLRALESEGSGKTNLFITPGYSFKVVDALVTNFHLPKSSLLVLVSAFAGTDLIKKAYKEAIEKGYRFYSFGDAMFIE